MGRSVHLILALSCYALSATTVHAQDDPASESVSMITNQVSLLNGLVSEQKDCLSALQTDSDWLSPCSVASRIFFSQVVGRDLSVYTGELGDLGVQKHDIRYLNLANTFFFYDKETRELSDEIWNAATDEQRRKINGS